MVYKIGLFLYSLTAEDFNRDTKLDLAVVNQNDGTMRILLGKGDGMFRNQITFEVGNQPYSITTADLYKDRKIDRVVAKSVIFCSSWQRIIWVVTTTLIL